jgi:phosphoribosylformimino-5-aminoimidazole carboxamide ribotide isomerase
MEIIPAIYILKGRCVALYKGKLDQKATYYKSPIQMARFFETEGAEKLHVVDVDALGDGGFLQKELLGRLASEVKIPVQVEASFQSIAQIEEALQLGIDKIVLRPVALPIIEEAIAKFGPEKIIIEVQAKGDELIMDGTPHNDPQSPAKVDIVASASSTGVVDFAEKLIPLGVKTIIYKDENSEGTLIHPNYDEVDRLVLITGKDLKIYVSGGIGDLKHITLLKKIGATGAIIGKAFFERILRVGEAKRVA